jgi:hypothetical protein
MLDSIKMYGINKTTWKYVLKLVGMHVGALMIPLYLVLVVPTVLITERFT